MKGIRKLLLAGMVVGVLMLAACTENTQETKQAGSDESATTAAATAQSEEVTEATEAVATTQAEAVTEAATNAEEKAGEITEEEALAIALKDAGVEEKDISLLEINKEFDDGVEKYDIDFHVGNTEYNYDIDLKSGEILEKESDVDDDD